MIPSPQTSSAAGVGAPVSDNMPGEPDSRRSTISVGAIVLPLCVVVGLLGAWQAAVTWSHSLVFPTPWEVVQGAVELGAKGVLHKYVISSLFRVVWSFLLAVAVGVPFGLVLGWWGPAAQAETRSSRCYGRFRRSLGSLCQSFGSVYPRRRLCS